MPQTNKTLINLIMRRLLLVALILVLLVSCGRRGYIDPDPKFAWPEMISSQISGKIGINIPENILNQQYKAPDNIDCCEHKNVHLGRGLLEGSKQAAYSVFSDVVVLKSKPDDTYIKSLELRGLLNFKDAEMVVEFLPFIEQEYGSDKVYMYDIKLSLNAEITAIDFMLSDIRGFTINVEYESIEPVPRHRINAALEPLADRLFELAADHLAKQIVTIYGARA